MVKHFNTFVCMIKNFFRKIRKLKVAKSSSIPITRQVNKVPTVIYFKMIDTLGLACNDKNN